MSVLASTEFKYLASWLAACVRFARGFEVQRVRVHERFHSIFRRFMVVLAPVRTTRFSAFKCHEGLSRTGFFPVPPRLSLRTLLIRQYPPFCRNCVTPSSFPHTRHDRFCSLSWYDRQLVENSRSGAKDEGSMRDDEERGGEEGEGALVEGDAGAADTASLSSSPRPHGSEASVGAGFGIRARPAEASVMATLKARGAKWLIRVGCVVARESTGCHSQALGSCVPLSLCT